jgi:hypothetical protein
MEGPDLAAAIAALASLKDEHRPLLMRIAADGGMEPETRTALVQHVLEEEDEKVAALVSLARAAPAAPAVAPTRVTGLTVGSLRAERPMPGRTLGSLREQ